jgi:archaetidylinositol phosphate synthase
MAVTRVNENILGGLERPTLAWMADRLPQSIVPDHLTAIGILGAVVAATGFVLSCWTLAWLWLASAGLLLNWLGDSLDGTLARRRGIERPRYGFFIDHTTDMLSQALIFVALGISPCAHFGIACLGLIAFLMMFIYTLIGAHVHNVMRITYLGFGATEIRALLLVGNLLILAFGIVHVRPSFPPLAALGSLSAHDLVISAISIVSAVWIVRSTIQDSRALALRDPRPRPAATRAK